MDVEKLRALIAAAPKPPCVALTPFSIVEADAERGRVRVECGAPTASWRCMPRQRWRPS